jgi:hypothetical protein
MATAFKGKATNKSSGSSEVPPAGAHPAVLIAVIDLGTHQDEYNGKPTYLRKGLFVWELTAEKMSGTTGRNHVLGRDYTIGSGDGVVLGPKSGLRKMLEGWRGKPYGDGEDIDIVAPLGRPCVLTVKLGKSGKGNDYAKIEAVAPVPKGLNVPPAARCKPFAWEISEPGVGLPGDWSWLPYVYGEKVEDIIKSSYEYKGEAVPTSDRNGSGSEGAAPHPDDPNPASDIPF